MKKLKPIIKMIISKNKILYFFFKKFSDFRIKKMIRTKNKAFLSDGKSVFCDFCSVLNSNQIKFWLVYGTLLGYIREGKILDFDCDFDVGVWYTDYSQELENKLQENGFKLVHQYRSISEYQAFEQTYEKDGVSIDVFYHFKNETRIWANVFYREPASALEENIYRIRELDYPLADLKQITFLDNYVYIPCNAEVYLEEIYGSNWRIPDPNYDWRKGPKANTIVEDAFGLFERF